MKPYVPLIVLVFFNLVIGLWALPGYGESMDELMQRQYGERTVEAVSSLVSTGTWPSYFSNERPRQGSHGPAFISVVILLRDFFLPEGTPIQKLHFSHFLYYIMFQVGVISLFFLARRWMSDLAAFGAALLFATQPLLVGHAFINPKDVVFMSLVIVSIVLGLWMVDHEERTFQTTDRPLLHGVRSFFRQFLRVDVWLAALLLGFTSAIRVAAPLVGLVIAAYVLVSRKWQLLPRVVAYGLIACCCMILFWPYIWPDPIGLLIESISNSAKYPDLHETLFRGTLVESQHTPRSFLPVLLAIQLTETTLILLVLGALALLRKIRWDLVVVILVWFVVPIVLILSLRVNLYDNFRQLFFLLPPLFLLAGLGLDWLLTILRRPIPRYVLLFLSILPGLYATASLYPYQYVYYNQVVGGVSGAFRDFELDYWHTAYREAQEYVNENARPDANIYAGTAKQAAQTFARPDLIFNALGGRKKNWNNYDYIIVSTSENEDQKCDELTTVFVVELQGVPLVYVKKP